MPNSEISTYPNGVVKETIALPLTLKAPITIAADDIHKYFFHCFSEKFLRKIKVKN